MPKPKALVLTIGYRNFLVCSADVGALMDIASQSPPVIYVNGAYEIDPEANGFIEGIQLSEFREGGDGAAEPVAHEDDIKF